MSALLNENATWLCPRFKHAEELVTRVSYFSIFGSFGQYSHLSIPCASPFWQVFVDSLALDIYHNKLAIGKLFFIRRRNGKNYAVTYHLSRADRRAGVSYPMHAPR